MVHFITFSGGFRIQILAIVIDCSHLHFHATLEGRKRDFFRSPRWADVDYRAPSTHMVTLRLKESKWPFVIERLGIRLVYK
jgi:hypothetical protein